MRSPKVGALELKICVVIPTYNEHENIEELVYKTENALSNNGLEGHIIIVDDNSPDGTGDLAEQLSERHTNIMVIHRPGKLGIGSAYRQAFQAIFENMHVDAVIQMDADLSHNPEAIPSFLNKLSEGFDVVIGSRYIDGGGIEGWPVQRWIISGVANFFARRFLGIKILDLTSGFRAYRSDAFKLFDLSKIKSDNYAFQVEMLYYCANSGFKIGEIPILFTERVNGNSKLGRRAILGFIKTIIRLSFNRFFVLKQEKVPLDAS